MYIRQSRTKKKVLHQKSNTFKYYENVNHYFLCLGSEDTLNFFLPFVRRRERTLRPLAEAMRSLKPCLFLRLRLEG